MKKAQKTRQYIIEKSAPIFNKKGYTGTSISDLTNALGLTKGAIYGNFENKEEIALESFKHNMSNIVKEIDEIIENNNTSRGKLIAFAEYYEDYYERLSHSGGCPLLNSAVDSDDGHPEIKKAVNISLKKWEKSIIKIINSGIENGEFSDTMKPLEFAISFISLIEGGVMMSKLTGSKKYISMNIKTIKNFIEAKIIK